MRRVATIQYQALTVPPPTRELIPPSFGWFRPLEQPDRERVGAARRVLPIATMVAQETPWPYNQPATDNANTRWYQQWVDPPRILKDPCNAAKAASGLFYAAPNQPALDNANTRWYTALSEPRREYRFVARITGETLWPYVQPASDNANARWFQPLSEPLRYRGGWRDWRYNAALSASGEFTSPPKELIPVTITADMWFAEWRLQQRYARDPRYSTAFAAGEAPWPYIQPATDNATTRWYTALSEPQRFPRDPRYRATLDASGELKWPYNQPASDNATTRWFQPLSEPRREYRFVARITGETPWPAVAGNPTGVFPGNWFAELSRPVRYPRDPRYTAAFAAGEPQWPYAQPASDNANARWFQPLSEPRREYRWIARAVGETPWSRIQPNPISMAWWKALEEPRRFLRDPKAATTLAASGLTWGVFTTPPPVDLKFFWLSPLSEPRRFPRDPRYSATLAASGQAPFAGLPVSAPLGATRRALLRSGAFPTFWPGAS